MVNNHVQLIGRIAKDVTEVQTSNNQRRLFKTHIAVKEKDDTLFFSLKVWGELGERFQSWIKKGDKVIVEGRLTQRIVESITDRGTFKNAYYDVIVTSFEQMTKKEEETARPAPDSLGDELEQDDCPF